MVYFEGQKFHEEEDEGHGEDSKETGVECFGEKAPRACFVTAALADFLMDFHIDLHFLLSPVMLLECLV